MKLFFCILNFAIEFWIKLRLTYMALRFWMLICKINKKLITPWLIVSRILNFNVLDFELYLTFFQITNCFRILGSRNLLLIQHLMQLKEAGKLNLTEKVRIIVWEINASIIIIIVWISIRINYIAVRRRKNAGVTILQLVASC